MKTSRMRSWAPSLSRRELLKRAGAGFGLVALADLLNRQGLLADERPAGRTPYPLRPPGPAKSVIFLFMGGGPSQVDTFDPKPLLRRLDGGVVPESIAAGIPRIARTPMGPLFASPYRFRRSGQSGLPISDLFPELRKCADDLCVIRSMKHDSPIHAPAEYLATTGTQIGDRPSLGAWISYGLGSENENMPAFIVMKTGETGRPPAWSAGFLPARFQATMVDPGGIPHIRTPQGVSSADRRTQLDLLESLQRHHLRRVAESSELESRIRSYELAYRMQMNAPEAFDLTQETEETKRLYGIGTEPTNQFGVQCLLARRFVERGVRFVQLRHGGWDAHGNLVANHGPQCHKTDRPMAGLLIDLKRRGLLGQTLVVWGGEFGRTPAAENAGATPGRNHSPSGYSAWLAGGGVRGGHAIGATDDLGYAAIDKPLHPNDLHATILASFGVDQQRLTYRHHNRDELLTVLGGEVVRELFSY